MMDEQALEAQGIAALGACRKTLKRLAGRWVSTALLRELLPPECCIFIANGNEPPFLELHSNHWLPSTLFANSNPPIRPTICPQ